MMRLIRAFGIAATLCLGATARAQDCSVGVPVYLTAQTLVNGSGTLQCSISGLIPGTGATGSSYANSSGSFSNTSAQSSGPVSLSPATLALQPNHVYWANFVTGYPQATLSIAAPVGYTVVINNVAQESYSFPVPNMNSLGIPFEIIPSADFAGNAGECSEMSTGQVRWEVALGWQMNGDSAGVLALSDQGTESAWNSGNVQALYLSKENAETYSSFGTIFGSGTASPGYIRTNQALVRLTNSGNTVKIEFFPWSQVSSISSPVNKPNWSASITGSAYMSYLVTTSSGPNTIAITKTDGVENSYSTKLTQTGASSPYTWAVERWATSIPYVTETRKPLTPTVGGGVYSETRTVADVNNNVATTVTNSYSSYAWGLMLSWNTHGSSANATGANSIQYIPAGALGQGMLTTVQNVDGSWTYENYSLPHGEVCALPAVINAPYNNSTASSSIALSTQYSYGPDEFNIYTAPTLIAKSKMNGSPSSLIPISSTSMSYSYGSSPSTPNSENNEYITTVTQIASAGSSSLTSTIKQYSELPIAAIPPTALQSEFLFGRPYSVKNPDNTMTCYAYQYGSLSGGQFQPANEGSTPIGPLPGSCEVRIHGVASPVSGASALSTSFVYPGSTVAVPCTIDQLYVFAGGGTVPSSTLESTIRDSNGLVVRKELYAYTTSGWSLVTATTFMNNIYGHVFNRTTNNLVHSISYNGMLLGSETDEKGVTTAYSLDPAGRIATATRPTANGSTQTTTYTYDGESRVTKTLTNSPTIGETITRSMTFDDAGRITSDSEPGLGAPIQFAYAVSPNSTVTTTYPDTGTKVETYQIDGRLLSESGSAVVPEFCSYSDPDGSGNTTTYVYSGSSTAATVRYVEDIDDGYGRPSSIIRPGFTGQLNFTESYGYDPTIGRLLTKARTGLATEFYGYDALGNANLVGLGSITTSSTQRLSGSNQFLENLNGAWWMHSEKVVYATNNSGTGTVTEVVRTRLDNFPAGEISDQTTTDMYQNVVETSDVLSGAVETITTTNQAAGYTTTEKLLNGARQSFQGVDQLTTNYAYDSLNRLTGITDPQGQGTSYSYYSNTNAVQTVTAAGGTTNYAYDPMLREKTITDPLGYTTVMSYDLLGRTTGVSGTGAIPVSYGYDLVYGDLNTVATTRNGSTWDTTTWDYDAPSGLLSEKLDAVGKSVQYTYNSSGTVATRINARGTTATYGYDPNTGQLTSVSYNDGTTPSLGYGYFRFGGLNTVNDYTGTRTFAVDPTFALQTDSETLAPGFYGSRVLTALYQTTTGAAGSYGSYSVTSVAGRSIGFSLGIAGNTARDLEQNLVYSNIGQIVGVQSQAASSAQRNFTFSYGTQNATAGAYAGMVTNYTASGSSFQVAYSYDSNRSLVSTVNSQWGSSSLSRFDYKHTVLGQAQSSMMSGSAFGDYYTGMSYSHVYKYHNYDGFGQLTSSVMYRGDTVNPNTGDEYYGAAYYYGYDSAGNRLRAGETGSISTGDDQYVTNSLNQYSSKENNMVRVLGTVENGASVTTNPSFPVGTLDRVFWSSDFAPNTTGPASGSVSATGTLYGPTSNSISPTQMQNYFVGEMQQTLQYDADGNLTFDGMWNYTYDAENRLTSMTNLVPGLNGNLDTITFKYDYLNRRVEKQVSNAQGVFDHRYVYSGNTLIAEIATSSGLITRSYTWGPNEKAPLLELTNFISGGSSTQDYLPAFDGNRNLVALVNATSGAIASEYEYGSFGELLRSQAADSAVADNPIRFSSEFTDVESALVYYGQRYYHPTLGQFITRDPIEESGGVNLYGFCGNDPIDFSDVDGCSFLGSIWDHTVGWLGKEIARHWDSVDRTLVEANGLNALGGPGFDLFAYDPPSRPYLEMAAAIAAAVVTYGYGAPYAATLVGEAFSVASTSAVATIGGGVIAGAAAGFVSGASLGAMSGQGFAQSMDDGLIGAEYGAIEGGISAGFGMLNNTQYLKFPKFTTLLNGTSDLEDLGDVAARGLEGAVTNILEDKNASSGFWSGILSGAGGIYTPAPNSTGLSADLWNFGAKGLLGGLGSMNKHGKGFMTGFWSAEATAASGLVSSELKVHDTGSGAGFINDVVGIAAKGLLTGAASRLGFKPFSTGLFTGAATAFLQDVVPSGLDRSKQPSLGGAVNSGFNLLLPKVSGGKSTLPLNHIKAGPWGRGASWAQLFTPGPLPMPSGSGSPGN